MVHCDNVECYLVAMLSHYLKELKTAIQCLGIKPKAMHKKMTPISRTLNAMAYKARSRKKKGPRKLKIDNSEETSNSLLVKTFR